MFGFKPMSIVWISKALVSRLVVRANMFVPTYVTSNEKGLSTPGLACFTVMS